ncbi:kinesin-like protein KIN-7C [Ziziphus jujuba]|uniref:Kinesin-like protein n=1 Tax=Ziziphus jujuba TaxID=326968 RepID=A0ABM3ITR4_ZIZJJ|nr:kinesin-like protein KIN-7C [Ziziphus jujuba]XP_048335240.2 kinesin-like protein KIN-7C [Ziziphus jujuba]
MGAVGGEEPTPGPGGNEKIFVSVRLRPLNEKEAERNDVSDWECINDNTIIYRNNLSLSERSMYPTAYTFDRVFRFDCSTRRVYEEAAKEVALSVVNGINSSIFAYGQTSSGKTYTMSGITEYTVADIYDYINNHKEREFCLKFSAMEIYNESVRDLLSADSTPLRLLDDPERGTIVERLTEETLRDWNHFRELLSICEAQRQIGETSLNEASSRSHQILRLTVESSAREFLGNDKSSSLTATVNFVDLAGSERASQTLSAGTRLKEGCHINRSLLTLGTVIRKLSKGRNGHVPYRDSKLTRILQSSLGGNARTAIICTLSPARSHVEQSRNTLLFASCAKEVTTNAQVNVVMSDKALVKHLQRELSRLESELRSGGLINNPSDSAALLREKDLQIEKLLKELSEVSLQRDLAQAQVKDLLQVVGDDKSSMVSVDMDHYYPKLRVRNSWDFENQTSGKLAFAHSQSINDSVRSYEIETSQNSDAQSRSSSDEIFLQIPELEETFLHNDSSPRLSVGVPNYVEIDLYQEETKEQSGENLDDLYKEAETEDSSTNRYVESNMSDSSLTRCVNSNASSPVANTATSVLTIVDNGDNSNQEFLETSSIKEDKTVNGFQSSFIIPSPEKTSEWVSGSTFLKLPRSRSCKASLTTTLSPDWFEKVERIQSTPPVTFEKNFTGRPEGLQKKLPALNYGDDNKRLSRNGSKASARSAAVDEPQSPKTVSTKDDNITNIDSSADGTVEKSVLSTPIEEPLADSKFPEKELKPVPYAKNVKDVGLDPISIEEGNPPKWPSEFKRLQKEIIELWHACNVSLVHRTYFFLLFKGDPSDSIYMEVELRRLTFIRDIFSRGNQTVEDGRTLTLASSIKALSLERQMLSNQIQKKLSKTERENIYLKWGIGLNTKHRKLQLAHRLWTDTKDMNHITESATIVAKLAGSGKPQAFKEMFGLRFTPRRTSRKYHSRLRQRMKSLV